MLRPCRYEETLREEVKEEMKWCGSCVCVVVAMLTGMQVRRSIVAVRQDSRLCAAQQVCSIPLISLGIMLRRTIIEDIDYIERM